MERTDYRSEATDRNPPLVDHPTNKTGQPLHRSALISRLDAWVADHPFHPRVLPYIAYVVLLLPVGLVRDTQLTLYPVAYTMQCVVAAWLLWRYRGFTRELNLRFHWLAIPVGAAVTAAWIALGITTDRITSAQPTEKHYFLAMEPGLHWASLALRLVGMSLIVPLVEEMFIRSWALRTFHTARGTWTGVLQIAQDMPVIGDWLIGTRAGDAASAGEPAFTTSFERTPVGALSVFGVFFSTVLFASAHVPRDWPGCVVCGVAYCLLLWWTNRNGRAMGLGPVVWAHGVTNALLLGYSVARNDWRFL